MNETSKTTRKDGDYLNTLARGLSVLRAFTKERPEMTLSEVAVAGYTEQATYTLNHRYCYSLQLFDPAKRLIEFTVDHEDVGKTNAERRADAHAALERCLAVDQVPNNEAYHR